MRFLLMTLASFATITFSSLNIAVATPQCKSNGDCCKELNKVWQDDFSQDFEMLSSTKYKLKNSFKCPSEQSKLAEGLQALKYFSSSTDYYGQSVEVTRDAGYGIIILELKTRFAEANKTILAIAFSATHTDKLSPSTYASQLVHEVEHVKRGADHVICNHGQNNGKDSCDQFLGDNFSDSFGAYTSQFLFLHDVRQSNANDLLKKTSRASMKAILENQINEVPSKGPDGKTPLREYYDL